MALISQYSKSSVKRPKIQAELHPKQWLAFQSIATEIMYGGASGGGKSHLLRILAIFWCMLIPNLQCYFFRRLVRELKKNHMVGVSSFPALLAPYEAKGSVQIKYDNTINFINGSTIHLSHCASEKDVYTYHGPDIHLLLIDELTQWTREMYTYLRSRVRLGGLPIPDQYRHLLPMVVTGANPGGIGHNWVKDMFVDPAAPFELCKQSPQDGGMLRQFIPALLEDNPTMLEGDPDYENRLMGMGSAALVNAMRWGIWDIVAGGFIDDIWIKKKDQIIIRPFSIPKTWRVDRSFDWGSSSPFSVGWWAQSDGSDIVYPDGSRRGTCNGDLFRIAEWYGWNGVPNEGCRMLASQIAQGIKDREASMRLDVLPGPADTQIFDWENGNSIANDMANVGIHWTQAVKTRKQGWQKVRAYLNAADKKDQPGMYCFETCRQFIRTMPLLQLKASDANDVEKGEDHIADETRYRAYTPVASRGAKTIEGFG